MIVNICGISFTIEEKAWDTIGDSEGKMGRAFLPSSSILIKESMNKDLKDSTILHEVLHMICDLNGIPLEEKDISVISAAMYDFLMRNKEYTEGLWKV